MSLADRIALAALILVILPLFWGAVQWLHVGLAWPRLCEAGSGEELALHCPG